MAKSGWTRRSALAAITASSAAACGRNIETPAYDGAVAFNHGVASGDPRHDRIIIWTRVTPERAGAVPVRWILARNRELTDVVKTGVVEANEARDYTVKVDVTGLRPGAPYFYGFRAGAAQSTTGRTRTLPRGRLDQLKLAVVSCASYPHGFFNAYGALAARDDVDVVVHLGDYIYEYGLSGYGGDSAVALGRIPSPEVECLRLQDYRHRHAQYKGEAELQAAHAQTPWVVVWDDHEVANDSWMGGAENHQSNEGVWANRKQAALQAYYEWMPIREPEPGRAFEAINRAFQFGDLFTLIMLETRLLAREQPHDYARDLPVEMQRWNFTNPAAPVALRAHEPDTPAMQRFPAIYEAIGAETRPVLDWRRAQGLIQSARALPEGFFLAPDRAAIDALLTHPDREILGEAQHVWLAEQLAQSQQAGVRWQVIGNQIIMAPVLAPDLSSTPAPLAAALERLRPGVSQLLKLTRFPFPLNIDAWDGYPRARARVLEAIRAAGGNTLVVTGDSHTAWANELTDAQGLVAVELGATSITSPSESDYFSAAGMDFSAGVRARNPNVKWTDGAKRGFLLLTLSHERALAEYMTVSTIQSTEYETTRSAAFTIAPTQGPGVGPLTEAS
ncbi:MAG: alkaline phosphatase D family protein [Hyphomonadaceae bacterium]|nr:alkaline phosphatase D family protein [Hyphomonadaceae bacterium]